MKAANTAKPANGERCTKVVKFWQYCRTCCGGRLGVPTCADCGLVGLLASDGKSTLTLKACS